MSSALECFTITSPRSAPRTVTVYVPGVGRRASAPLPVLLLHDGQNLFDPQRSHIPGHTWRVAETADALIAEGRIPPMLIAGIDHAGERRLAEFTPTRGDQVSAGHSTTYGRFLLDDLLPYLVRSFNARADVGGVGMGGSSLGGLATLAITRQFPNRFGKLLVMSPSVWWDERVILRRLRRVGFHPRPRVWLDSGRREGARTLTDTRALRDQLIWQTTALRYVEDPEGDHSEDAWARRLPAAMEWLYANA